MHREKRQIAFGGKPLSLRRVLLYPAGLFIMALGLAFAIRSELGVSPVTSVPYVCARILGISVGTGTIVAYFVFLFLELCVYRRHFRLVYVLQIPAAFLFGWFTDVTMRIAGRIDHHGSLPVQLAMVIVGVVIVGLGLRLYLTADIIAIPPDALAVAFAWRTKKPLHLCKRVFDCCMVLLSAGLSLAFFRDISGLWIGTVIAALGVGYALKFFSRLLEQPLERWLYGEPAAQALTDVGHALEEEFERLGECVEHLEKDTQERLEERFRPAGQPE
ncbi:MAG: DUF6198 family protein [Clostridiales bacterium]|nr:DUF6198 family protein [Clostridiales bacterium]